MAIKVHYSSYPVSEHSKFLGDIAPLAPLYLLCCIMYNLNRLVKRLHKDSSEAPPCVTCVSNFDNYKKD